MKAKKSECKELRRLEGAEWEKHAENCNVCKKYLNLSKELEILPQLTKEHQPSSYLVERVMERVKQPEPRIQPLILKLALSTALAVCILLPWLIRPKAKTIIIKFELQMVSANAVSLVGDFNNWNSTRNPLKLQDGKWEITLKLKPGRYQYMFVINGKEWIPDPNAVEYIEDGFGNRNSIIEIKKI